SRPEAATLDPGRIPVSDKPDAVVGEMNDPNAGGCPVTGHFKHPTQGGVNSDWWPNQLNLKILRKHPAVANPMRAAFDYRAACPTADRDARPHERSGVRPPSEDWWPAAFGP